MGIYRFDVSLRFRHPNIDPKEITTALGLAPDVSWRAGEQRATPKGMPLEGVRHETYWCARIAEGDSRNVKLAAALHKAIDNLDKHSDLFHRIYAGQGRSEFFVGWYLKTQAGDEFDHALLARMTYLRIDLSLDNYHDPDLPDEE